MKKIHLAHLLLFHIMVFSQSLPLANKVDWTTCGYEGQIGCGTIVHNAVTEFKIDNTGQNDATAKINSALLSIKDYEVLYFPNGIYLLKNQVNVPSKRIIRGQSPTNTIFSYNSTVDASCFYLGGTQPENSESQVLTIGQFGTTTLTVKEPTKFKVGDDIDLFQANDDNIHNPLNKGEVPSWALNLKGQMAKIKAISGNQITLDRPFTYDYDITFFIGIRKVIMAEEIGLENFKLIRTSDNGLVITNNNFWLIYAKNCWFKKIHSEYTSRYHFRIEYCRNIEISECFLDKSYNCGGGGAGYGILTADHTTDCKFENNIARSLRHPWIPKEGASKNVYAYNYSFGTTQGVDCSSDPITDSYADISVHGHYPAHNLFEGNIVYRITSSDAWGANGPGNTFFRNRVIGKKAVWVKNYSKFQNIIGNELTYPNADFRLDIDGTVTGTILNFNNYGVSGLLDKVAPHKIENSLYLSEKPDFFMDMPWPCIGPGTTFNKGQIPAELRFLSGRFFSERALCSKCKSPSLGPERSLCGQSIIELKGFETTNNNYAYTWFKNGVELNTKTFNLVTSEPGEYSLRTDSIGCNNEDFVTVRADIAKPSLGDDFTLCNPSERELISNVDDANLSYQWFRNGKLISQKNTLTINLDGSYILSISANSCQSTSDTINVLSRLINYKGDTSCLAGNFTKVEILDDGQYSWHTDLTTKLSFATTNSILTKQPKVYIEKTNRESFLVGMKKPDFRNNRAWSENKFHRKIKFEVKAPLSLDSLSFWPENATTVEIRILDSDNTTEIEQKLYTNIINNQENRVAFGVELKPGIYFLDFMGSNGSLFYSNEKDPNVKYPFVVEDLISISAGEPEWVTTNSWYMYAYNWRITSGNICQRTPVDIVVDNTAKKCSSSNNLGLETLENRIKVFPNPSNYGFETSGISIGKLTIFNSQGLEIESLNITDNNTFGHDLPVGTYIVKIQDSESSYNFKVIKY